MTSHASWQGSVCKSDKATYTHLLFSFSLLAKKTTAFNTALHVSLHEEAQKQHVCVDVAQ